MNIKILSPLWGHENLEYGVFLDKVKNAGYDGFDTWIPEDKKEKKLLFDYLQKHEMYIVAHQHQANGKNFTEFKKSFLGYLNICAEADPILINSHTGRDYFTLDQNLQLIDIAQEFSDKSGVVVVHETHRGRVGYSPQMIEEIFKLRESFSITADFSHWVCVTESMLENFTSTLTEAIKRSRHIHLRIGFEQGPQVADPRAPEWKYALDNFLVWWDRIVEQNYVSKTEILPVTTEFGPKPYMPAIPFTKVPVADQFTINCYMKDLADLRYKKFRD
ncbi:sugar phosphate isomerase/epimerase [Daejeonella sp.]|uniref:sugar phosphate isomerase/epimerase n=1 Tax=Daejeonella sp. TaxID=2805397 RepID=UPI003982FDBE